MDRKFLSIPYGFIVVFCLSILPLITFLHQGIPITHDGQDHVARIANFYNSLSEGNLIPRWASNLNWGYGHPILMFLYPLSSYIASIFHYIGFNFNDSYKLVMSFGYILSGIFTYLWLREQFDDFVATLGSLLYIYAPYRFVDIYVRGAIGEHLAFAFLPLLLYSIFKFYNHKKDTHLNYIYFNFIALSTLLLLLSHNAMSIIFLPVGIFYAFVMSFTKSNYKQFLYFILALLTGFLLSSFFIIPAFLEGKYTLRDIVIGNEYEKRFVEPMRLIYSTWSYGITGEFSQEIGYLHMLGIIFSPLLFMKMKGDKYKLYKFIALGMLGFLILGIFLMLNISNPFYQFFTVFKKFQFPWRFLSLVVFTSAVVGGMLLLLTKKKFIKNIIVLVCIIFLVITSYIKWQAKGFVDKSDRFYSDIYRGTTDTGESAPVWSVRFMEKKPLEYSSFIEGNGMIQNISRSSTSHKYLINVFGDFARIRENTLYFPGWQVFNNGEKINTVEYQDPSNRGLITYRLDKGLHGVEVKFEDTKLRKLSNFISFGTFIAIIVVGFYYFRKNILGIDTLLKFHGLYKKNIGKK